MILEFVVNALKTITVIFALFFKHKTQREDTREVDPLDSPAAMLISCLPSCQYREVISKDEISTKFSDKDYMLLYYSELDSKISTNLRFDSNLFCREGLVCEPSQHSCENFIIGCRKMSCSISSPSPIWEKNRTWRSSLNSPRLLSQMCETACVKHNENENTEILRED